MSLQKRLRWLLIAFASFALVATFGTIYAVRLHLEDAIASLQRSMDEAAWIDQVRLETREQHVRLREVIDGLREPDELYRAQRDGFFDELRQVAHLALLERRGREAEELLELTAGLRRETDRCLVLAQRGERDAALAALRRGVETQLLPALNLRLRNARAEWDDSRNRSVDQLLATHTQVLILAVGIGMLGIGLVTVGTALVRRWIVVPIRQLEAATQEFSQGNLDFRVPSQSRDELGALGRAMNRMAESLASARAELQVSEGKYRSLFRNLRDTAIICDAQGRVIECHDGDTHLLGRLAETYVNRSLHELWSELHGDSVDWAALLGRVLTDGNQVRITELRLRCDGDGKTTAIVDLIAYPVEFRHARHAAVVLRDVSERHRLEGQARLTEAMEATVTLARGVAHDFNSLLTSAIGSLSMVGSEIGNGRMADQIRRALRACGQAAGLSRTLLSFAGGDRGDPEALRLRETIEMILESLDEEFFDRIEVHTELSHAVLAYIDRDQFTQVVLNLLRNAREAMPEGGDLHVRLAAGRPTPPVEADAPPTHALLSVSDTGCGISPEVQERLFEPFFTTKSRGSRRRRGMGLAIVYAAVKNAGGLIQVEGTPGAGTTFRVCLPLVDQVTEMPTSARDTAE